MDLVFDDPGDRSRPVEKSHEGQASGDIGERQIHLPVPVEVSGDHVLETATGHGQAHRCFEARDPVPPSDVQRLRAHRNDKR